MGGEGVFAVLCQPSVAD